MAPPLGAGTVVGQSPSSLVWCRHLLSRWCSGLPPCSAKALQWHSPQLSLTMTDCRPVGRRVHADGVRRFARAYGQLQTRSLDGDGSDSREESTLLVGGRLGEAESRRAGCDRKQLDLGVSGPARGGRGSSHRTVPTDSAYRGDLYPGRSSQKWTDLSTCGWYFSEQLSEADQRSPT